MQMLGIVFNFRAAIPLVKVYRQGLIPDFKIKFNQGKYFETEEDFWKFQKFAEAIRDIAKSDKKFKPIDDMTHQEREDFKKKHGFDEIYSHAMAVAKDNTRRFDYYFSQIEAMPTEYITKFFYIGPLLVNNRQEGAYVLRKTKLTIRLNQPAQSPSFSIEGDSWSDAKELYLRLVNGELTLDAEATERFTKFNIILKRINWAKKKIKLKNKKRR